MKTIIAQLENNGPVISALFASVPVELRKWKQQEDKWCALEILCHMRDEEIEDFRARTKHVLQTPENPMPGIDPVALVKSRKYMEQDYDSILQSLLSERKSSIAWLNSLVDPDWNQAYNHPKMGPLKAKMFLINWLEHDYLHLRQLITLKHNWLAENSVESLKYAGDW